MNRGYGEGEGVRKKTERELEFEKYLAEEKRKKDEIKAKKDKEKRAKKIPGVDDGMVIEPNNAASVKKMDIPFNKDSTNRDQNVSSEIVDPSTEGGMEDWLDKEMEAEENDPSLNPEKGVVVGEDYIIKDGKVIKDKIGEFGEEIENMGNEDLYNRGDDWYGVEEGVSDENVVGTEDIKKEQLNNSHNVDSKTPRELSVEDKARIGDDKDLNYKKYKNSDHGFGRKPGYKDKPSGIKNFWNKLTGKE